MSRDKLHLRKRTNHKNFNSCFFFSAIAQEKALKDVETVAYNYIDVF